MANNPEDTVHLVKGSLLAKLGLSVRGVIVIILVVSACAQAFITNEIPERLLALASAAVGYYFGQQHQKSTS